MPRYINTLQLQKAELEGRISLANDVVTDLYVYLTSPKFHNDTTVQVQDVLNRLDPLRLLLNV